MAGAGMGVRWAQTVRGNSRCEASRLDQPQWSHTSLPWGENQGAHPGCGYRGLRAMKCPWGGKHGNGMTIFLSNCSMENGTWGRTKFSLLASASNPSLAIANAWFVFPEPTSFPCSIRPSNHSLVCSPFSPHGLQHSILIRITLYCGFLFYQSPHSRWLEQGLHRGVFWLFIFLILVPLRCNRSWNPADSQ